MQQAQEANRAIARMDDVRPMRTGEEVVALNVHSSHFTGVEQFVGRGRGRVV